MICHTCGTTFEGRRHAKTCSDRCRQRLRRSVTPRVYSKVERSRKTGTQIVSENLANAWYLAVTGEPRKCDGEFLEPLNAENSEGSGSFATQSREFNREINSGGIPSQFHKAAPDQPFSTHGNGDFASPHSDAQNRDLLTKANVGGEFCQSPAPGTSGPVRAQDPVAARYDRLAKENDLRNATPQFYPSPGTIMRWNDLSAQKLVEAQADLRRRRNVFHRPYGPLT